MSDDKLTPEELAILAGTHAADALAKRIVDIFAVGPEARAELAERLKDVDTLDWTAFDRCFYLSSPRAMPTTDALGKAIAETGNYTADAETRPQRVTFVNGRTVWVATDEHGSAYLEVGWATEGQS